MIKGLFLDWFNVFEKYDFEEFYKFILFSMKRLDNSVLDFSLQRFVGIWQRNYTFYHQGSFDKEMMYSRILIDLGFNASNTEFTYMRQLVKTEGYFLNFELIDWIKALKRSTPELHFAVITNSSQSEAHKIAEILSDENLEFVRVISASDFGFSKPDTRLYKIPLDFFNLSSSDVLYVDDKDEYLETARSMGFKTVQFDLSKDVNDTLVKWIKSFL